MKLIFSLLCKVTGNRATQKFLERIVKYLSYLLGVGAGSSVRWSGESQVLNKLLRSFGKGATVFDVGANKGQFIKSLLENSSSEVGLQIHSFEPANSNFRLLTDTYKELPNVHLNKCALGESTGKLLLYSNEAGSGLGSLTKRDLSHMGIAFDVEEEVDVQTIDEYCKVNSIEHIELLKIDVEGHELQTLRGASAMLKAKKIANVTVEFGGCNIDTRTYFRDFYNLFKEMGMVVYRITPSGYLHEIEAYKEEYEQFRTTNFIAKLAKN